MVKPFSSVGSSINADQTSVELVIGHIFMPDTNKFMGLLIDAAITCESKCFNIREKREFFICQSNLDTVANVRKQVLSNLWVLQNITLDTIAKSLVEGLSDTESEQCENFSEDTAIDHNNPLFHKPQSPHEIGFQHTYWGLSKLAELMVGQIGGFLKANNCAWGDATTTEAISIELINNFEKLAKLPVLEHTPDVAAF